MITVSNIVIIMLIMIMILWDMNRMHFYSAKIIMFLNS